MAIPTKGWLDLKDAPKNGAIIMVLFRQYNQPNERLMVAAAQWLPSSKGDAPRWCRPWALDSMQYADSWMTVEQYIAATAGAAPVPFNQADWEPKPAATVEFDL